jgi:hypothetical protein
VKLPNGEMLVGLLDTPDALYHQTHEQNAATLSQRSDDYLSMLRKVATTFECSPILEAHPILLTSRDEFRVEARLIDSTPYVIVHEGFRSLLRFSFAADLVDAFAAKGLSPLTMLKNMLVARYLVAPFTLPAVETLLPDAHRAVLAVTLSTAELFAVLHEIAHIRLGHIDAAHSHEMMASVTNAELAQLEHEADRAACSYLSANEQVFVHGVVTMLSQLDLCETVLGPLARTHPTARQRMLALRTYFDEGGVDAGLDEFTAKPLTGVTPHFATAMRAVHPYELCAAAMEAAHALVAASKNL